ncbi:MAG TPA: MaoC family dehydratase [Dehalococcoidia bacterium]|nr:MaoC family dehydratase [Dehalococcoidia bacterium]
MLTDLQEGADLPGINKEIRQENINRYADASGDHNPIHINEDYARETPLGGTVAHGMLMLAYISQMMTGAFGRNWLESGSLDVRFRAPARPGDTISVSGKITALDKAAEQDRVSCSVLCQNQNGESVITGIAEVKVSADEDSH